MGMGLRALPLSPSIPTSNFTLSKQTLNSNNSYYKFKVCASKTEKGNADEETPKPRKQNLFESVTEALDFAQVRSAEDAVLIEEARSKTRSGEQMSKEQYGALRRKIGGTYKDFFKSYVEVDGEYVEEGWVDKTCKVCKKDTRGKTFETIDPRTEEVIANIAEGDKDDVDLAVKAAREAFDHGPWPRMSGSERGRIMMKFLQLVEENIDELAALDTLDVGKLFELGKAVEIPGAFSVLRYYAGAADKIHGKTLRLANQLQGYTLHEPIGVVGHIIPWNVPVGMFLMKTSPALAAGCTMLVKPAEQSPLSALYLAHLAKLAGIPDGVINVVTGFGETAGAAISSHMYIDCVSFTGSTEVGRVVMQAAATSNLKAVSLELGGKAPLIVFDDVDVDSTVNIALRGGFANKGEYCVCSSRLLVQEGIYDEFVTKFALYAKGMIVGDPFDPSTHQGPQVDKQQYEKVLTYIEHGKRQGATLLTGGKPCGEKGYYIEPTIFSDVTDDMLIATDEIFGPVVSVIKFKTIEEAIAKANSTCYGLAAGIATKDLNIANTVSRSLRAGIVWINCYLAFDAGCPYGGYKMSGFGREFGMEGLYKYLQVKSVVTPLHNSPWL